MHEVALAEAIVDIVTERAKQDRFQRARAVCVELGELAHVLPDALVAGFVAASAGTPAEGARLALIRSPGTAWCVDCSAEVRVRSRVASCPACGGARLLITGGDEMRVAELEVV